MLFLERYLLPAAICLPRSAAQTGDTPSSADTFGARPVAGAAGEGDQRSLSTVVPLAMLYIGQSVVRSWTEWRTGNADREPGVHDHLVP